MRIYYYKSKIWNETINSISKTIFSPIYVNFNEGDIYVRISERGVHCKVLNGKGNTFYDQDFGAGSETYYGETIDINKLIQTIAKVNIKEAELCIDNINKLQKQIINK